MKKTLLLSSAGRRNQLMQAFRADAAGMGIELRVLAADANPTLSPACHEADEAYTVPSCTSPDFIEVLAGICRREKVDLVIPTIDPELGPLSRAREVFAAIGTRVVVSSPAVVAMANDKLATAQRLAAAGVGAPATARLSELRVNSGLLPWPVIVKPNGGSASQGVRRLDRPEELGSFEGGPDFIAQECLEGREYTVNVYFTAAGLLCCAVPHLRIEVRSGEVSKGRTERVPALAAAAEKIASSLPGAEGPLCFQAIVDSSGKATVFEINARFGGGYPLAHRAGARFSAWLLEESCGLKSTACDVWQEGVTMLRYDSAVYFNG